MSAAVVMVLAVLVGVLFRRSNSRLRIPRLKIRVPQINLPSVRGLARRGWRPLPRPVVDRSQGDAELSRLLSHAAASRWEPIRDSLTAVTDQTRLTWMVGALAQVRRSEVWLEKAVANEPDTPLPLLLSGARHVLWGWEARTGARASQVSEAQWRLFRERLEKAEEQLYRAAELAPEWNAPWYFLQTVARGLSFGPAIALRRYEAAQRRAPEHLDTDRMRLQQLSKKWGGSYKAVGAFVRERTRSSPPGSVVPVLVVDAHLEHWLELEGLARQTYFRKPHVVEEVLEAARRSVLHPEPLPSPHWTEVRNSFAMALALAGQWEPARQVFRELDGQVTDRPWQYLGPDVRNAYTRLRAQAFDAAR